MTLDPDPYPYLDLDHLSSSSSIQLGSAPLLYTYGCSERVNAPLPSLPCGPPYLGTLVKEVALAGAYALQPQILLLLLLISHFCVCDAPLPAVPDAMHHLAGGTRHVATSTAQPGRPPRAKLVIMGTAVQAA